MRSVIKVFKHCLAAVFILFLVSPIYTQKINRLYVVAGHSGHVYDLAYYHKIRHIKMGNYALTATGQSGEYNVYMYPSQDLNNQLFCFKSVGNRAYKIIPKSNQNMVLEIEGGQAKDYANIRLNRSSSSKAQHFRFLGGTSTKRLWIQSSLDLESVLVAEKSQGGSRISSNNNVFLRRFGWPSNPNQRFLLLPTRHLTGERWKEDRKPYKASQSWQLFPLYEINYNYGSKYGLINPSGHGIAVDKANYGSFTFEPISNSYYRIKVDQNTCIGLRSNNSLEKQKCSQSKQQRFKIRTWRENETRYVEIESHYKRGYVLDAIDITTRKYNDKHTREAVKLMKAGMTDTQVFKIVEVK